MLCLLLLRDASRKRAGGGEGLGLGFGFHLSMFFDFVLGLVPLFLFFLFALLPLLCFLMSLLFFSSPATKNVMKFTYHSFSADS